jgi:hypothetical protein
MLSLHDIKHINFIFSYNIEEKPGYGIKEIQQNAGMRSSYRLLSNKPEEIKNPKLEYYSEL